MQPTIVRYWPTPESSEVLKKTATQLSIDAGSSRAFVQYNFDPLDPTIMLPVLPIAEHELEQVTCRLIVYDSFSQEGIYRENGVTLQVKTVVDVQGIGDGSRVLICQQFNFSAPNIEALRTVYTRVRQGDLDPIEPWRGHRARMFTQIVTKGFGKPYQLWIVTRNEGENEHAPGAVSHIPGGSSVTIRSTRRSQGAISIEGLENLRHLRDALTEICRMEGID